MLKGTSGNSDGLRCCRFLRLARRAIAAISAAISEREHNAANRKKMRNPLGGIPWDAWRCRSVVKAPLGGFSSFAPCHPPHGIFAQPIRVSGGALNSRQTLRLEKRSASSSIHGEIFDVVDQEDVVIAQEKRSEVHRKNLFHRAIHIFLWNQKGKLLLQKRSASKDVAPHTWDSSVAGHLGVGEDYDHAAKREIIEELGVSIEVHRVKKFKAHPELGWEFVWLYEGKSEGPFQFLKSEISKLRWWSIEEIDKKIRQDPSKFAPSFRYIWKNRK